jgi:hypothetical protein
MKSVFLFRSFAMKLLALMLGCVGCDVGNRVVGSTDQHTPESVAKQLAQEQAASEAADEE